MNIKQLRDAINGLDDNLTVVPSLVWGWTVVDQVTGNLVGYLADDGFRKFEKRKDEPCKESKPPRRRKKITPALEFSADVSPDTSSVSNPVLSVDGSPVEEK